MTSIAYAPERVPGSSVISTTVAEWAGIWRQRTVSKRKLPDVSMGVTDVTRGISYASQFDLQRFAYQRIAGLRASGDYIESAITKDRLGEVLSDLVEDGGPTPQVGATADRSIEVQWLCNGTLISAIIEHAGDVSLMAENSSAETLFDYEFGHGEQLSGCALHEARDLLRQMAIDVKQRPFDWHSTR